MAGWTTPGQFSGNRKRQPRLDDLLPIKKLKPNQLYKLRAIGLRHAFAEHWIRRRTKEGKVVSIRKLCLAYDGKTEQFTGECPYCSMLKDTPRVAALQNFIDRKLQENKPVRRPRPLASEQREHKVGKEVFYYKDKESDTWTPVEPVKLSSSPAQTIEDLTSMNTRDLKSGETKTFGPEHPRYGFDIGLKHNPDVAPAKQYFVGKDRESKLTEEEQGYLIYRLDVETPEDYETAKKEAEFMGKYLVRRDKDGKDYDDPINAGDDDAPRGKKARGNSKHDYIGDLDEDDDTASSSDEDDEDETPRRKAGKKLIKKGNKLGGKKKLVLRKKRRDDDDDDDIPF